MPSVSSLVNLRHGRPDHNDPVEQILARHGIPARTKLTLKEGPRAPAVIDEIIADIRALNAKATH